MNFKGQSSLEFLLITIVILALFVIVFANLPQNTNEISSLGITKNKLDEFILKTNYLGNYSLKSSADTNNLNINIVFSSLDYNSIALDNYIEIIENNIKNTSNFGNVYISYN